MVKTNMDEMVSLAMAGELSEDQKAELLEGEDAPFWRRRFLYPSPEDADSQWIADEIKRGTSREHLARQFARCQQVRRLSFCRQVTAHMLEGIEWESEQARLAAEHKEFQSKRDGVILLETELMRMDVPAPLRSEIDAAQAYVKHRAMLRHNSRYR